MTDREKLIGIMGELPTVFCDCCGEDHLQNKMLWLADHLIANGVTVQQWIPVTERLPELPDEDFCDIYVNALYLDTKKVIPRLFSRSIVRGKRVERWHYPCGNRLAKAPDFWMPLPGAERSV